ncbi:MAG: response regulator transcription factor [Planctomycetaceae bacterium]
MAHRRKALLHVLAHLVQADAGFWFWGRGRPDQDSVTPMAIVDFGLTSQQRVIVMEWGLERDAQQTFHERVMAHLREDDQATTLYDDVFSKAEWDAIPKMRQQMRRGGWESWVHSVRNRANDTWSMLFFLRNLGRAEFGRPEADIVDLAMTSVTWMHSTAEELLPQETLIGLKPRQRTVMLMLLDGLTRKTIAGQLGITEHTVGDHVKAIYQHFRVGSATELAALFLRGK